MRGKQRAGDLPREGTDRASGARPPRIEDRRATSGRRAASNVAPNALTARYARQPSAPDRHSAGTGSARRHTPAKAFPTLSSMPRVPRPAPSDDNAAYADYPDSGGYATR